ncbi:hypothetical protein [Rivihabitans pingtungensis]|uniref:hypothetical protein n=1 Tax=Rivihabitans pingtungensis TaxID=1054498 RepID=UPI002357FE21|nr:hypothetical protein [Rivihabitans pingtungensis]MCK6437897.1 hypothetical protein [Rivihabitans pingtungensis]
MQFFDRKNASIDLWLPLLAGPVLSLLALIIGFLAGEQPPAGLGGFLVSVIMLLIGQWWAVISETKKSAKYSDQLYEAIKDQLLMTPAGEPATAIGYISSQLPNLRKVMNTSFNTDEEVEHADQDLYFGEEYNRLVQEIPKRCRTGLIWNDLGDKFAITRFRLIHEQNTKNKSNKNGYTYRLINHNEPQINFIILEYNDQKNTREVLFNWDFRSRERNPRVLISRHPDIVGMFSVQFNLLWERGAKDHDNHATKSNSEK